MKLRYLLFTLGALTIIVFVFVKLNEAYFVQKLTQFFPAKDENTPGYYRDLISFLFEEGVWLIILLLISTYFTFYGNLAEFVRKTETLLLRRSSVTLILGLSLFAIITVVVATVGLRQFPNSADEFAYLFQAEQLSEGKLWDNVHPVPDFFEFHHLAQKDGKWVGRFPPGWPLVLSLAYVLHIPPFLINTLIGMIAALVLYKLVKTVYDERIAMWSFVAMLTSSFFIFNSATYFSHTVSLLEGLLFVFFCYRYLQVKRVGYVLLAGFFLGLLIMTRQLTALIFFVPMAGYILYQQRLRAIMPLLLIGVGAIPGLAFFLWYNYQITGDPLVPVTMWTNSDEAIGFVKGHTPMKGMKFTFKRLIMFLYWASPSFLLLYFVFLAFRLKDFRKIMLHPEDYIFILLIVGYFFYYHSGGNQYGPRFYLEGFPFLIVFIVVKALRTNHKWAKVFLFCAIVYNAIKIPFIAHRERQVVDERMDIYDLVEKNGIHNAVVFISSETGVMRPMPIEDLNRNDRYYKNDVIYARDLGEENYKLMNHYKDKQFYIYSRGLDAESGALSKIDRNGTPQPVTLGQFN